MTFFATAAMVCLAQLGKTGRRAWLVAAASCVGLASLTKETGAILLVSTFVFLSLVPRFWRPARYVVAAGLVGRNSGLTLQHGLDNAYRSLPDAVAVISWNEWSENTYIEPGEQYGDPELVVLKAYLQARGHGLPPGSGIDSSSASNSSSWTGARAAVTLGVLLLGMLIGLPLLTRRRSRSRRRGTGRHRVQKGRSREPEPHDSLVGTAIDQ
jgi:4-amino-4-deoxy-L-arabinose transferase-like glycosyltransferase